MYLLSRFHSFLIVPYTTFLCTEANNQTMCDLLCDIGPPLSFNAVVSYLCLILHFSSILYVNTDILNRIEKCSSFSILPTVEKENSSIVDL